MTRQKVKESRVGWHLTPTVMTRCPESVAHKVSLLSHDDGGSLFFICWDCRQVRQAGVGLIEAEPKVEKTILAIGWTQAGAAFRCSNCGSMLEER